MIDGWKYCERCQRVVPQASHNCEPAVHIYETTSGTAPTSSIDHFQREGRLAALRIAAMQACPEIRKALEHEG